MNIEYFNQLFSEPLLPQNGSSAQREMAKRLVKEGFSVTCEKFVYGLKRNGEPRDGWLDIYAHKDGFRVAIEIDRGTPKTSSIEKLTVFNADLKISYHFIDRRNQEELPPGVIAVCLPYRIPTLSENSFKGYGRHPKTNNF